MLLQHQPMRNDQLKIHLLTQEKGGIIMDRNHNREPLSCQNKVYIYLY